MSEQFVQRLAVMAARHGLKTKAQLAKALGVGRTMLFHYETNPSLVPEHVVQRIEELERSVTGSAEPTVQSGVPSSSMVREDSPPYRVGPRMVPVLGWVHAGEAENYEEIPKSWQERAPTDCRDPHAFAVKLEGESMADYYQEGDVLFIAPSSEAYSGCLAICKFTNDGLLFRRVEFYPNKVRLVALNPAYPSTEHLREEFAWIYPVFGRWTQIFKR